MKHKSVFDRCFDVGVYGCGYAGLAAAWALAHEGKQVLLFDRRMDIAWESGRAFVTDAGICGDPLWKDFLNEMNRRNLFNGGRIDCAGAEIVACSRLRAQRDRIGVLLGAFPVRAEMCGEDLVTLDVATKSGVRSLSARAWIDASEEGALCKLAHPQSAGDARQANGFQQRAVLVAADTVDVTAFSAVTESTGVVIEGRPWTKEIALVFENPMPLGLDVVAEKAMVIRGLLGEGARDARIAMFSVYPLPLYHESETSGHGARFQVGNLWSASPAFATSTVRLPGERFQLGVDAAHALAAEAGDTAAARATKTRRLPVVKRDCEVLIAGAGTAGALAATTVLDEGGAPLIVDPAPFLGGVGTGGLISGYFHGQKGGGFERMDGEVRDVQAGFDSVRRPDSQWHAESKKTAFERRLARVPGVFLREALVYAAEVRDGRIVSVRAATAEADYLIEPKAVIDATGDGDVAALAGASFDFGRVGDGHGLAYSQPCLLLKRKNDSLRIASANYDAGWVDATDPEDLTRARMVGIAQQLRNAYQEEEHILQVAPLLGLRQSRNFHTEQIVGLDDLIRHRRFDNAIGVAKSPLDTHSVDFEFEDDETLFWMWGCKHFRGETFCDMPYGMLVPRGLTNIWLACRAAGITPPAAYALRMQRDLQRMGEAAAYAAIEAVRSGADAMALAVESWRSKLERSGALTPCEATDNWHVGPMGQMLTGEPGGYMWTLYANRADHGMAVAECLEYDNPHVSWLAAVVLAMWGDARAEPRLVRAISTREQGVPTPASARGAHGQWIDVPNWFLAVNLLRCCGSGACLSALAEITKRPDNILNLRTSIALTLTRLAPRLDAAAKVRAADMLQDLFANDAPDQITPPSRSIYRALRGESQKPLGNEPEWADTREDQSWRIAFTVAKAAAALGVPCPVEVEPWLHDERALTRKAFNFCSSLSDLASTS